MSLKVLKRRNWTHKSASSLRKYQKYYLTPEELGSLPVHNELATFRPEENARVHFKNSVSVSIAETERIAREIRKEFHPIDFLVQSTPLIHGTVKDSGYMVYQEDACEPRIVLDLHRWSKKFSYFQVSTRSLNPSGDTWILSIDFVGNQTYHLFTKSLYADDYQEIKLPKQHRLQNHQLLANHRTSSSEALWLDDSRILYVSLNRYYNQSGVHLYDVKKRTHQLLYKNEPGTFIHLQKASSGLFVMIYISNYHSDEIRLMDTESLRVHAFLPREFSVSYPYLDHSQGKWRVYKRDKGIDTIATTFDFKTWDIFYQNKNPYEQILQICYDKECFFFTLTTLKGVCLYALKCRTLKRLERSFSYYTLHGILHNQLVIYKYKYTCPYQTLSLSVDTLTLTSPKMTPRYHEEEVFIHPKLRVTLLYKTRPVKSAPCLLRGYGAYNQYEEIRESIHYYPLLERGFVVAIAHLRGGGDYGYKGYDEGRMMNKKNTFQDFIDTAHYLIDKKWTSRDQLAIWGRSCGGLLIASVLNQEPDLCRVALAGVPFVSLLETMKNQKTPLGIETQAELGNIDNKKVLDYVRSYAPLEHIQKEGHYPHMLIYTNVNDTSVPFKEPVAYYQALKKVDVYASGKADLSFYMDPRFGHYQGTLFKDRCDHYGLLFAYVLKYLKKETL